MFDRTVDSDEPGRQELQEFRERIREITGEKAGQYLIEIEYHPEKFLRNVSVDSELKMPVRPRFATYRLIREVLEEMGFVPLDDRAESEIAHFHCNDTNAVNELLDEIKRIRTIKERYVQDQEFENAARTRDEEYVVRNSLDDLLKQSAG